MKKIKQILCFLFVLVLAACEKDYINTIQNVEVAAPTEVAASFNITNDNSGNVTITPKSNGGLVHVVSFNDGTSAVADTLDLGESMTHQFVEGNYTVNVEAVGYANLSARSEVPLVVSFRAPENLVVEISNDEAISRQVNVTASADYATNYQVFFGEGNPPVIVNADEVASFVFSEAGTNTIRVVANSGGSATTEFVDAAFEVTAIMQPLGPAPRQQSRNATDYISIFSGAYDDETTVNTFPDWGQGGNFGSGWTTFTLEGDAMLQYTNLSYQGIEFGGDYDLSQMEYLHMDVWTADVASLKTFLIRNGGGDAQVTTDLTQDGWTSIEIPISAFTDQGLDVSTIFQIKFEGGTQPWPNGTIFVDNIYFYKVPTGIVTNEVQNFDGASPPTVFFFGNANGSIVNNPDTTGENTTAKVVQINKVAGAEVWAGSVFETGFTLDFDAFSKISIQSWSPSAGVTVRLKVENAANGGIFYELDQTTTVANAWETLTWDFSGIPDGVYNKVVVFYDFGNVGDGTTYYYDTITLVDDSGAAPTSVIEDVEGTPPAIIPFGNASAQVIANPDTTGDNTSANAIEFVKTSGAEVWAGVSFEPGYALDFDNHSTVTIKTWSPKVGATVRLKVENAADGGIFFEADATTTVANGWETLTWDFSAINTNNVYNKVVVFFDFGVTGDGSTYYFDDVTLVGSVSSPPETVQDFEGTVNALIPFGNAGAQVIANPDTTGDNTSSNVVEFNKVSGAEVWAGVSFESDPLDFSNYTTVSIKTWSPKVGAVVRLKVENAADGGVFYELDATTTVANAWETLTWDFSAIPAGTYDKVVVFFDFGNSGDGSVYYYDEIILTN